MNASKFSAIMRLALCLVLVGSAWAQKKAAATPSATNASSGLVGELTQKLHITPEQATGGAGAIFGLAKGHMNPAEFSKVAEAVPGMNKFLKAAPAVEPAAAPAAAPAEASTSSSALGSLGSMGAAAASGTGALGAAAPAGAGGLTSLAGSFQKLGLNPAMAAQFVPVMQNYIGSRGGAGLGQSFASALK